MLFTQNMTLIVRTAIGCGVDESDCALQLRLRRSLHQLRCAPHVTSVLKPVVRNIAMGTGGIAVGV
jgi:hypothetical protein